MAICEYCCACWAEDDEADAEDYQEAPLRCSFCGEITKPLIAGPAVYICRACIDKSLAILDGRPAGSS